ncbi:protein of unknown function [Streptococcus thermophilus]|nr:protein of unknown function [Streptococcus thermophilus]CAD0133966.1 protein of unknown function [Streptococcus thermophilus]CAD0136529.1 protein of unknown function [Streptococcus thermophilus]CAD0181578.1 protein of unknown function [Streptococcus thermophilus]CAD0193548.1 protein of unknown function [Streptococcus thermophilus]
MALWLKGPIQLLALLISIIATTMMCWRLAILCTQTIGVKVMCPEAVRALIDLTFKELGLHKIELTCLETMSKVNESQRSLVSPMKLA